jgi:hypothetical protein
MLAYGSAVRIEIAAIRWLSSSKSRPALRISAIAARKPCQN